MTGALFLAALSLAGEYTVSGPGVSGTLTLPGTLADARLGRHMTEAEYEKIDPKSIHKGCLTREYQYLGKAAYVRRIVLTEDDCRVPLEVFLERVMWKSEVFLDGVSLGAEDILSVPHVHPVPPALATPGEHELRIEVDNSNQYRFSESSHSYGPQMQSVWHGVLGRMEIRERNPLRDVRIFAAPGGRTLSFEAPEGFEANAETVRVEGESVTVRRTGGNAVEVELARVPESWSEFHPRLYFLVLTDPQTGLVVRHRFGFRSVAARDHALYVNGVRSFIRGNVENCNFAKDGSPALTKEAWLAILRPLKREDGINALRFHTWTPTAAAFEAADELGAYLLPEADIWVDLRGDWDFTKVMADKGKPHPLGYGFPIDGYVRRALKAIARAYGNSPSFLSLGIGNELGGTRWDVAAGWIEAMKRDDPRRLYFVSTAREVTRADDYMVTHSYPGVGLVRKAFRPSTDWDYEAQYAKTGIPTMAHEIGQWPVYPMWDFLSKFTGHLRPYNIARWKACAERHGTLRFNRLFHEASARQSRLIYKDEVESFLRTPSCAGVQLLNAQDFTGQGEALVGWRDPFYDLKPGFRDLPAFGTVWNVTNFLARVPKWTWRRGETFRARLQVRNLGETAIPAGEAFPCALDGKARRAAAAAPIEPGRLAEAGTVELALDGTVALGPHELRFGTNRWRFWVYPDERSAAVPDGVLLTDDPQEAAARLASGGTVLYTGTSVGGEKDSFRTVYWVGNKTWDWRPPLGASLGTCVFDGDPALRGFPTENWTDWQWYHLVQGANLHRLDDMPKGFRLITMSVSDFHFSFLASSLFEAKVGKGRLLVCGYRIDGDDPAQVRLRASLLDYLASGEGAAQTELPVQWFEKKFCAPPR